MKDESVSLREYFEAILRERDKRQDERFAAQGNAISKAEQSLTARLDLLNELRTGVALKSDIESANERLLDLKSRLDRIEARSGGVTSTIATIIAVGAAVVAALGLYLRIH